MKQLLVLLAFTLAFVQLKAQDTTSLLTSKAWTTNDHDEFNNSETICYFNKDNTYIETIKLVYQDNQSVTFGSKGTWKMQENGEYLITITSTHMKLDMPELDEETRKELNKHSARDLSEDPIHYDVRIVSISEDELSIRKKMSPNGWDTKWVYNIQYH